MPVNSHYIPLRTPSGKVLILKRAMDLFICDTGAIMARCAS